MIISRRIKVTGRVQGVWFRVSTKRQADSLGLGGWVKNMDDGSVLIEVYGPEDEISQFIAWCQQGPELAKVRDTIISNCDIKEYPSFSILR